MARRRGQAAAWLAVSDERARSDSDLTEASAGDGGLAPGWATWSPARFSPATRRPERIFAIHAGAGGPLPRTGRRCASHVLRWREERLRVSVLRPRPARKRRTRARWWRSTALRFTAGSRWAGAHRLCGSRPRRRPHAPHVLSAGGGAPRARRRRSHRDLATRTSAWTRSGPADRRAERAEGGEHSVRDHPFQRNIVSRARTSARRARTATSP